MNTGVNTHVDQADYSDAMRSVEIKHELRDPELAIAGLRKLRAINVGTTFQIDSCYRLSSGRLIKRVIEGEPTEWIAYHRDDSPQACVCRFTVYSENEAHTRFGTRDMPVWTRVRKRRELWIAGPVRIHVDMVDRLGWFIEFEALISPRQNAGQCRRLVESVRNKMRIALGEAISVSYSDLAIASVAQ